MQTFLPWVATSSGSQTCRCSPNQSTPHFSQVIALPHSRTIRILKSRFQPARERDHLPEYFALAHSAVRKTAALYGTSRTRPSSRLTLPIATSQSSLVVVVGVIGSPMKYALTRNA